MSQSLSLLQTQRQLQILAPQLRQSLEMLQLPMLELRALIQHEMEQNPTIEEGLVPQEQIEIEPGTPNNPAEEKPESLDFEKEYEVLAKLDDEWRDYFYQNSQSASYSEEDEEKRRYLMDSLQQQESLQEHLLEQLRQAGLSEKDRQTGELIVGSINDDGYLAVSLDELAVTTGVDARHLEDVLAVIQDFHPAGVGARDLRECLLLQLEHSGHGNSLAATIVKNHLDDLGNRKYQDIAKALQAHVDDILAATRLIEALDPKPGQSCVEENPTFVVPEVVVQKVDGKYVILMDDDQLPHVRISGHYRKLLEDPSTPPDVRSYVQEKVRAGAFLIKSIYQRQKTIRRIATEIVQAQTEFLDHGISHLRPMTMAHIAEIVGVHETTVSRAVSGKFMKTPIGIFELKYFFTPGIKTADGKELSNKTVRDMIATMINAEDIANPLADQEIVEKLSAQGVNIARRTVAKYRLILRIPPSHMRKAD